MVIWVVFLANTKLRSIIVVRVNEIATLREAANASTERRNDWVLSLNAT